MVKGIGMYKNLLPIHHSRAKVVSTARSHGASPRHTHHPSQTRSHSLSHCEHCASHAMEEVHRVPWAVQDEYVGHTWVKVKAVYEERGAACPVVPSLLEGCM